MKAETQGLKGYVGENRASYVIEHYAKPARKALKPFYGRDLDYIKETEQQKAYYEQFRAEGDKQIHQEH